MIRTKDAIKAARAMLGAPYGSGAGEIDCINLIKHIIRTCPGGKPGYTTAGTNALWRSYEMSAKYRDLVWRQEGITGARAGMLAFERSGADTHHVGLVTEKGTVIHASSARGAVAETPLNAAEGWNLLGMHRYIEVEDEKEEETMESAWTGIVMTQDGSLNLRVGPDTQEAVRAQMPKGAKIDVLWEAPRGGWLYVRYRGMTGYASAEYVGRADDAQETPSDELEGAQDATKDDEEITLTLPRKTAQALYEALGWAIS